MRDASREEWQKIWWGCEYSTYFHSPEWADIWQSYSGGRLRPEPRLILFSDGKRALLPFSAWRFRLGILPSYVSSPAGTFGGWLTNDLLTERHVALLITHLTRDFSSINWRLNPYDPLLASSEVHGAIPDSTHVLPLSDDLDIIRRRFSKGHRSAIRSAVSKGVQVRLAETAADWDQYYRIYEDSLRRWGARASARYEWPLFEALRDSKSSAISLWLSIFDGEIIAGALCLAAKRHVSYWHGAALERFFSVRPVHLLVSDAISQFHADGYVWFDFNPSGGHEGVSAFKQHFGAISLPCPVYARELRLRRGLRSLRGRLRSR
jgi:hypothetical protein